MTNKKQKLAIFDIDGTIFRSSLIIEFVNALIENNIFPKSAYKKTEKEYQAWLKRKGGYDKYIKKVVDVYFSYIEGTKKDDVDKVVRRMLVSEREKVYRFTRDLIERLNKKGGYYMIAISGSPIYAVRKFAKFMGFNMAFGTENIVENGIFKKQTKNKYFSREYLEKLPVLIEYLDVNNINPDWEKSMAIGDSEPDIPILNKVGFPIAFNPSSGLAKYAKRKKWKIIVERKNVIYDIKDFRFIYRS